MTPSDAIASPLAAMGYEEEGLPLKGGFGAVLAQAGVGKTAFLVQMSLSALTRGKNVLHVSLTDPIKKVNLWYKEVFQNLTHSLSSETSESIWMKLLPHRFIMSFNVEGFSVPTLEERMADLTEQEIFLPQIILVDGLPLDDSPRDRLTDLKGLITRHELPVWLSVRTHREDRLDDDGIPSLLTEDIDLFDLIIQLLPEKNQIHVKPVKWPPNTPPLKSLRLDPSTMLINNET